MDYWSILLALSAIVLTVYYTLVRGSRYKAHGIPCAKSVPFLGSMWKSFLQRVPMFEALDELYRFDPRAKYIMIYDLMTPAIFLRDLDLIKSITVKNFEHFRNHRNFLGSDDNPGDVLFRNHLFVLRDEKWKEMRNKVTPTFTSSRMKSMFVLMKDCAKRYGESLASMATDGGLEIELKDTFTKFTNDVVASCAFGIQLDSLKDPKNQFLIYGRESTNFGTVMMLKMFLMRGMPRLSKSLGLSFFSKNVTNFFVRVIAENIKERQEKGIKRPDIIQLLMDSRDKNGDPWTIEEITSQAFIFFIGGFDSVSTLMSFAAYSVATNDNVQRKLQEEIDKVYAECNGDVTYDAINGMKYLDSVVNETLRMYPVALISDRICTKSFELPPAVPGAKPYVLREGDVVTIPIYNVQHDPNHYTNPDLFDPERYASGKCNASNLLSFGLGPRMCIGNRFALLETKALLFYIFANCSFERCSKSTVPLVMSKNVFAMASENGYWLKLVARKKPDLVYVNTGESGRVR